MAINYNPDISKLNDYSAYPEPNPMPLSDKQIVAAKIMALQSKVEALCLQNEILEKSAETLRDRFAMAALTGMMTHDSDYSENLGEIIWSNIATAAYGVADAMLKAREVEAVNHPPIPPRAPWFRPCGNLFTCPGRGGSYG